MQIISVSIDLTKIDKSRIKTTGKDGQPFNNGAKYLELSVTVNDAPDKYGNDVSVAHNQSKEEREAKADRIFLGNGKVVWKGESKAPQGRQERPQDTYSASSDESNQLPF